MGGTHKKENDEEEEGSEVEFVSDKNYGEEEKYDPSFHGPIDNRSCTDIICCLLFIVFIVGMFIVGGYAWMNGDPRKLVYPTDYKGQICGISPAVETKPYLLFFDLLKCSSTLTSFQLTCPTRQVCVKVCPNETYTAYPEVYKLSLASVITDSVDFSKFICDYDFDPEEHFHNPNSSYQGTDGLLKMLEDEKCATYYLESQPFLERCIPKFLVDIVNNVESSIAEEEFMNGVSGATNGSTLDLSNGDTISIESLGKLLSDAVTIFLNFQKTATLVLDDFYAVWYVVIVGLCASMVISFLYIFLMRFLAGPMVMFGIIGLHIVLAWGCYYCWVQYKELKDMQTNVNKSFTDIGFTTDLESYLALTDTWFAFGIILGFCLVLLLLITLCLCKQIRIAVGMIQEASKAVASIMSTLLFPIVPFVLQVFLFVTWGSIALFLASSGVQDCLKMSPNDVNFTYTYLDMPRSNFECDCSINYTNATDPFFNTSNLEIICEFQSYLVPDLALYFQAYNLFGLFWLMCFIVALCQVTLAGAFASWYWAFDKKDTPTFAVTASFWRAIRYHLGSIAFGSLIIAIIKMIRVMLEYVERKLKGQDNDVVKYIIKCLKCCFWCLEKFMKFLNKNAYIMIAVYGKNFCTSAKKAFFLLMRNLLRVFVVNQLTDFLLFLGVLFVVLLCSVASFYYFTNSISVVSDYVPAPQLNYYWLPILTIGVGSYVIAKGFFSVYDMCVDTLFLCFLEDLERHDGSAEKPYYMSKNLMKIVGKKNKKKQK